MKRIILFSLIAATALMSCTKHDQDQTSALASNGNKSNAVSQKVGGNGSDNTFGTCIGLFCSCQANCTGGDFICKAGIFTCRCQCLTRVGGQNNGVTLMISSPQEITTSKEFVDLIKQFVTTPKVIKERLEKDVTLILKAHQLNNNPMHENAIVDFQNQLQLISTTDKQTVNNWLLTKGVTETI